MHRFEVGLPASGRTIEGAWAVEILTKSVPSLVEKGLLWRSLDQPAVTAHVHCVEDQEYLREQLKGQGLVAFIGDGSVLPRAHGASDRPMAPGDTVPFSSPETLRKSFILPNRGSVSGMGVPSGVTLLVGGGFHGKSTLLTAIQLGVYNHIPGDGRELVSCHADAVKVRAEDGRPIHNLDISAFINNLPFGRSTEQFSTGDASGSTSQAANIAEAMEMAASVLIMDEDTCATNFMYRDERMASLVHKNKEPITPFLDRVRRLYTERSTSTILVVGSCGAYFDVADNVIALDCYSVSDVTAAAHATKPIIPSLPVPFMGSSDFPSDTGAMRVFPTKCRTLQYRSLAPAGAGKVNVHGINKIFYGSDEIHINLNGLEQLREIAQVNTIADVMQRLAGDARSEEDFVTLLDKLERLMDDGGLDAVTVTHKQSFGGYARPRRFELAAAISRWRNAVYS